ncbi:MAG: Rrf2 family transcriptional regulator, partial [Akkermansia sp.]|nr:Rrf2 family transcriptional regulator [Akkermansia sp.]
MLKISTKGRYALRLMIDLAHHVESGPVSLRAVAERQQVTLKYMESIMSLLLREELVISTRGKSGGYKLTRA